MSPENFRQQHEALVGGYLLLLCSLLLLGGLLRGLLGGALLAFSHASPPFCKKE